MDTGWICLHRKMIEWEWYTNSNVFRLFIHCLIKANHKDKNWRGISIPRGSFITSTESICGDLRLSVSKIRTALDKLKMTGEIAIQTTPQHTVLTVLNYESYQGIANETANKSPTKSQTNRKQIATTNNDNNDNNKNLSSLESSFGEFWAIWPYKKAKSDAEKAWQRMSIENRRLAYSGVKPFWAPKKPDFYINPATYLNGKRWEDEQQAQVFQFNDGAK